MSDYDNGCPWCGAEPMPLGGTLFTILHESDCNDPVWEEVFSDEAMLDREGEDS